MNSWKVLKFEKYSLGGHRNFILFLRQYVTNRYLKKKKGCNRVFYTKGKNKLAGGEGEYTEGEPLGVFRKDTFNGNLLITRTFLAPLSTREKQTEPGDWYYFHF